MIDKRDQPLGRVWATCIRAEKCAAQRNLYTCWILPTLVNWKLSRLDGGHNPYTLPLGSGGKFGCGKNSLLASVNPKQWFSTCLPSVVIINTIAVTKNKTGTYNLVGDYNPVMRRIWGVLAPSYTAFWKFRKYNWNCQNGGRLKQLFVHILCVIQSTKLRQLCRFQYCQPHRYISWQIAMV